MLTDFLTSKMWQVLGMEKVESNHVRTISVSVSRWRILSVLMTTVIHLLDVTSAQVGSLDISNAVAYTGKMFFVSLRSHPVYGNPGVNLQLSASSESQDSHSPTWLHFNHTARTISGVPLAEDKGRILLTITAKCVQKINPTKLSAPDCIESSNIFHINVVTLPWTKTIIPVLDLSPDLSFYRDLESTSQSIAEGCEGERIMASLILCESVSELNSEERLNLIFRLSSFLTIPVNSITLEHSASHILRAVENGFQVVSAGPGSEESCFLTENIEMLWWLPCSTVEHLNDFVRVLQHNVDGGRLQSEIRGKIIGWYVASSASLLTRQGRRRRFVGHRTVQPTPAFSPPQPTTYVSASAVDNLPISSQYSPSDVLSLPLDVPVITDGDLEPSHQTSSVLPSRTISSTTLSSLNVSFTLHRTVPIESLLSTLSTSSTTSTFIQPSPTLHQEFTTESLPKWQLQLKAATQTSTSTIAISDLLQKYDFPPLRPSHFTTFATISTSSTSSPKFSTFPSHLMPNSATLVFLPGSRTGTQLPRTKQVLSSTLSIASSTLHHMPEILKPTETEIDISKLSSKSMLLSSSSVLSLDSSFQVTSRNVEVIYVPFPTKELGIFAETQKFPLPRTYDLTKEIMLDGTYKSSTLKLDGTYKSPTLKLDGTYKSPTLKLDGTYKSPTVTFDGTYKSPIMIEYSSSPLRTSSKVAAHPSNESLKVAAHPSTMKVAPHPSTMKVAAHPSTMKVAPHPSTMKVAPHPPSESLKVTAHPPSESLPEGDAHFNSQQTKLDETDIMTSSHQHWQLPHSPSVYEKSDDYISLTFSSVSDSQNIMSKVVPSSTLFTSSSQIVETISQKVNPDDRVRKATEVVIVSMDVQRSHISGTLLPVIHETVDHTSQTGSDFRMVMHTTSTTAASASMTAAHDVVTVAVVLQQPTKSSIVLSTSVPPPRTRTRPTSTTAATTSTTKRKTTTTTFSRRPAVRRPTTPKERSTQKWTPRWEEDYDTDEEQLNNRPYVQKSIRIIRADQGKLFELTIPHDIFYDIEDGDTRHLSLSLELPSNQALPSSFWLYLDSAEQVIKGLPLHEDMDIKNTSVVLVARDAGGMEATDYITLQINDTPRRSFTHAFRMKFAINFQQFMRNRRNITTLLEKVATFFGDTRPNFMTVLEVKQGSFVFSWTNNTLTQSTCPTDAIKFLHAKMIRREGTIRSNFSRQFGRHLQLKEVQLEPLGTCLIPPTTTATTTTTKHTTTTTHMVSEIIGHGFSIWAHVILPVLIAVLVFILIILIAIFCNRRRRQRQAAINAEKEAMSNDCNPFLFPPEFDPESSIPKARDPPVSAATPSLTDQMVPPPSTQAKNNLNRDQERARKCRDNREQELLNRDNQIQDLERDRDWGRNWNRRNGKEGSSGKRQREHDRMSGVSASSTLSWDRPNNHYLEEEAGSRSSTLKSTKSIGSDKRHRKSPPPYWQPQTDPPPYRMPPPYLTNNATQL